MTANEQGHALATSVIQQREDATVPQYIDHRPAARSSRGHVLPPLHTVTPGGREQAYQCRHERAAGRWSMYCGTVASSRCCITDVTRAWPCLLAVIATAATSPSCPSAGGTVWCAGPHGAAGTWVCWASCAICDRAGRSPSRPTARAARRSG